MNETARPDERSASTTPEAASSPERRSVVGVDVGGTFTDVYVFDDDGTTRAAKAPTTPDTVGGVMCALYQVVEPAAVGALVFGSTIATNALVERRMARVGLLTTKGFRDVLDIRRLWRPELFGHRWDRPPAIVPRHLRLEASGRIDWRGRELEPLDEEEVRAAGDDLGARDVEAIAVSFLFSYLNPAHEQRAAEILAQQVPSVRILLSSDINPERSEYERTSTTVIAAGLAPIVDRALRAVEDELLTSGLSHPPRVMKSNGGVMSIRTARDRPVELVKSGPAGGASAGIFLAERLGEPNLILLDIGGTTADASLIVDGQAVRADRDSLEWDIPVRVPIVDIRSVGAGGGSIAHVDKGGALRVGPQSAGATPGPVAYGRGGTAPTVTDAALTAGWINPDYFLGGSIKLAADAATAALRPLAKELDYTVKQCAAAVTHMATVEMAALVRKITVDRGLDPRSLVLVAFGGAGPLFVGSLLEELDMHTGLVPRGASTLSAMGGAFADITFDYRRSEVALARDMTSDRLGSLFAELEERARVDLRREGAEDPDIDTSVDLRYAGQWHELEIPLASSDALRDAVESFEEAHESLWGHRRREDPVELTAVRVRAISRVAKPELPFSSNGGDSPIKGRREVSFFLSDDVEIPVLERDRLGVGYSMPGPVIVEEPQTTTVVLEGQRLEVTGNGDLLVKR